MGEWIGGEAWRERVGVARETVSDKLSCLSTATVNALQLKFGWTSRPLTSDNSNLTSPCTYGIKTPWDYSNVQRSAKNQHDKPFPLLWILIFIMKMNITRRDGRAV